MKIHVIGCGNAFSSESFNQSFVIEEAGRRMLIDCGMQTPQALVTARYKPQDIHDIYVSHLHADHVGGLEYFAFARYDWAKHPRSWREGTYAPRLIGNVQLLRDLWDKTLRGGLESMEGFVSNLETFFEPVPVEPNKRFEWQGWTVDLIQQIHIMSGSVIMPSFGILFSRTGRKSVYFVTDSQHCSPRQIEEYYKRADLIFQDCECTGMDLRFPEGAKTYVQDGVPKAWPEDEMEALDLLARGIEPVKWSRYKFSSGVHANYAQLAGYESANSIKLDPQVKAKMWLSHYQDYVLIGKDHFGNEVDWAAEAKRDGFAGFVKLGQRFEV